MPEQPEALRLANLLETDGWPDAAFELRRLEAAHGWQYALAGERLRRIEKLEQAARQALEYLDSPSSKLWPAGTHYKIIAALRKVLGDGCKYFSPQHTKKYVKEQQNAN
jgi:hypothetical protein